MANNKLQQYFPMIRTRKEVMAEIYSDSKLKLLFESWKSKQQEEFLDFCTGTRGVKMLYDSFAKELLNPEIYPERLNELISLIIGEEVSIVNVFPNDNTRIADESSLLVMDIVVKLQDGSIANVEIQKYGYHFPGQRSACYSADLLLRQYKMVRSQSTRGTFSYKNIKTVYTIVLFEKSTNEFHTHPDIYIHKFEQQSNTGLELDLLQKYFFIPLDIFQEIHHNKTIETKLEAWLTFLSSDAPDDIVTLIEQFPDFRAMYQQIYEICQNIEKVMNMFSEELRELDRNTVRYMMDEMQDEMNGMQNELDGMKDELDEKAEELKQLNKELNKRRDELSKSQEKLTKTSEELSKSQDELRRKDEELQKALKRIQELEEAKKE